MRNANTPIGHNIAFLRNTLGIDKGVFKGGGSGGLNPPEIFRFFLNSEGKEIERKRKKGVVGGGGLPLNIFLGLVFFRVG